MTESASSRRAGSGQTARGNVEGEHPARGRKRGRGWRATGEHARVARRPVLIPLWFRADPLPCTHTMVRAPIIYRSQAILRRMETAAYERNRAILREDRKDAPGPQSGAPTMARHDQPRMTGSAGLDVYGRTAGG